ncbi:MAG: site-specific DNA-methyltransferase [Elusimicrobiota bacterium]|nr:site-specific DNA-methyltransferase [Elusimicrobiota bacterium]
MKKKMDLEKDSPAIAREKLEYFKKLFPEAMSEGKVDVDALRRSLGENVVSNDERYNLDWAGKAEAFKALQASTTATLAPCPEESVDFDKTGNVFIEGENLEVLKVLQKAYYGKIKMIYIDPPYNTGSDSFIYPDRFQESKEEYLKRIEEKDEEGYLLKEGLFRKNSKENGQYHSNWLSMMYPRLFLARNLLRDDGVIFISIDDNEVHNLRLLMNEVFGEENFVANAVWQKRTSPDARLKVSSGHEYVLIYAKDIAFIEESINLLPLTAEQKEAYKNPDNDPRGPWVSSDYTAQGYRPNQMYPITTPGGAVFTPPAGVCWKNVESVFKDLVKDKRVWFGKDGNAFPRRKTYLSETEGRTVWTWWSNKEVGHTQEASKELKDLFNLANAFDNPKPVRLIDRILQLATKKDSIILDFFSGSGTTAAAVLELNKSDGGTRKFICVQLPEKTDDTTEAGKAGYKTIAEIGEERIRRVIKRIKEDAKNNPNLFAKDKSDLDFGVKVFKLKNSNFKIWRGDVVDTAEDLENQMDLLKDPVKPEAREQNLLWELLLKSGYDLNTKITDRKSGNAEFYSIADGKIVIILSKADEKWLQEIVKLKPQKVICLDNIFEANDQLKTNTALQMKDAEIEFRTI